MRTAAAHEGGAYDRHDDGAGVGSRMGRSRISRRIMQDIVDTAVAAGTFKTLATALTAAGLIDTLKGTGPFTVLAPTDEAFAKVPAADLDALLADKAKLTAVLTYHVVSGRVMADAVTKLTSAMTVEGSAMTVAVVDGKVVLNGTSHVTATDIAASNGVIHVIDTVLMPPTK
jgi:uncharacterized surface protein with fasciclin (FAS1) repeats